MHAMSGFIITFVAMNGLAIPALVAQTPKLQTVPLSAEIDVVSVRTLPDGNTLRQEKKMKFYRRADGSTRLEEPNRAVIVDNGAQIVTVLDSVAQIAQVQTNPVASPGGKAPLRAIPQPSGNGSIMGEKGGAVRMDLGVKVIAGYIVHGIQRTTTVPANSALGNTSPISKTTQVWSSSDLRLPLLTVISDPLGGTTTSQYQNISTARPPDSSLFTIPAGCKVVQSSLSHIVASHTN